MGHESYVCGFIELSERTEALTALSNLPETSEMDEWPFLTSSMFSITETPSYREWILHFAASYKDILGSWGEWEEKFESFLSKFSHERASTPR